ncbi:MAG: hypothetical protein B7X42_03565, partial [Thiomonas sp. 14-66-4]
NPADLQKLGLGAGERVDVSTAWGDGIERCIRGFMLVEYDIPPGCLGAYYPETNPLVPLDSAADRCGTPAYKSIPVLLERTETKAAA